MRANEQLHMDRDLQQAYDAWLAGHCKQSKGDRRRRLEQRISHAERLFIIKVWWPLFGHLNNLHPEFEIKDFKDGWRFLDFAYLLTGCKVCIEIDGFGPHWRDINRNQFSDQLMRQNHLILDGWSVLRFSYDDILEKPRACQSIISQLIGRLAPGFSADLPSLEPLEMLLFQIALSKSEPLTPAYAAKYSGLHRSTAVRHLRALSEKQVLVTSKRGTRKICSYRVNPAFHLTP